MVQKSVLNYQQGIAIVTKIFVFYNSEHALFLIETVKALITIVIYEKIMCLMYIAYNRHISNISFKKFVPKAVGQHLFIDYCCR